MKVDINSFYCMDSTDRLRKLYQYDTWSCQKVLTILQDHRTFKLREDAVSIFAHIIASQDHWYGRITGHEMQTTLWPDMPLDKSEARLANLHEKWQNLITDNEDDPDRMIRYRNSNGIKFQTMLSDILHHLIIHGQHHRAQIALMLRQSGIDPPATDFIFYLREIDA